MSRICSVANGHVATPSDLVDRFKKKKLPVPKEGELEAVIEYWKSHEHKVPDGLKIQKSQHRGRKGVWGVIKIWGRLSGMKRVGFTKRATRKEYCDEIVRVLEALNVYGESEKVALREVSDIVSEANPRWAEGRKGGVHSSTSSIASEIVLGGGSPNELGFAATKIKNRTYVWLPRVRPVSKEA